MKNLLYKFIVFGVSCAPLFIQAGETNSMISFEKTADSKNVFRIAEGGYLAPVYADPNDAPAVLRAAGDFVEDIQRITGKKPDLKLMKTVSSGTPIIIGTIGKSALIDELIQKKKLDVSGVADTWEAHVVQLIQNPYSGVEKALVIAGSDRRGTIYGMYGISEKSGVSPWYYFADVPVKKHENIYVNGGRYVKSSPKVKYRGIFINDEEPAFGGWARAQFGGINSKMYVHVFELILRLGGNYMWPAMWGKAFNEDDPQNPVLAEAYGIVMGTSHHEPMIRAQQEYTNRKQRIGAWNFSTNSKNLSDFWKEGVERNIKYENVVTVGMRGDGDEAMNQNGHMEDNIQTLKNVIDTQRKLIAEASGKPADQTPQMWAVYKEVQDYYDAGMRVPDDVTIMWCDDNWGNIRHVPAPEDLKRKGGAGMYYHVDYVGGPRSYRWLNVTPLAKIREQMDYAYQYGIDRLWILNTGDLKPMELPIEFFLKYAWDPASVTGDDVQAFTEKWAEREFGSENAKEIAALASAYTKYNAWRKPEGIGVTTFSVSNWNEADHVNDAWKKLVERAIVVKEKLPAEYQDAYYELIYHPIMACSNLVEMYVAAGKNRLYSRQGRTAANYFADQVQICFDADKAFSRFYNTKVANGKWSHMMDQTHIGYTSWDNPRTDVMPSVTRVQAKEGIWGGIAAENSEKFVDNASDTLSLMELCLDGETTSFEIFSKGTISFDFRITSDAESLQFSNLTGKVDAEGMTRVNVSLKKGAKVGTRTESFKVVLSNGTTFNASVPIHKVAIAISFVPYEKTVVIGRNPVLIPASGFEKKTEVSGVSWKFLPDFGRGDGGMTVVPVTAKSMVEKRGPELDYPVLLTEDGEYEVDIQTAPTLNFIAGRGVRLGVAIDDGEVQVLDPFTASRLAVKNLDYNQPWGQEVQDNLRHLKKKFQLKAGVHTIKVVMIDAAVTLERIIVTPGMKEQPKSYFGAGFFQ